MSSIKYFPSTKVIVLFVTSFMCFVVSTTFIKIIGPILNFEKWTSIASHNVYFSKSSENPKFSTASA